MATQFPTHDINPDQKGEEWHRQFAKAALEEFETSGIKMFYNAREDYKELSDYVMGKQSVEKHKKSASLDEAGDPGWVNTDWSVRPITAKLRDIALAKLTQQGYNITATPIDLLARDETETYYAKHKAKIQIREEMMKINPELANNPIFAKEPGDPADMEELEMMMQQGIKLKVAMEAEMGIDFVFYRNNFKQLRRKSLENWFDFGPGGYKEFVDSNDEVKVRVVNPAALITSFCLSSDFSDGRYIGEVIEGSVGNLPFDEKIRKEIAEKCCNKTGIWDSSAKYGYSFDKEKVAVLDLEFKTYNDKVWEQRQNSAGNLVHRRTKWEKKLSKAKTTINGEEKDKYIVKTIEFVYKCKWVIGTDHVYDIGPATYQKRTSPNKALSSFNYHLNVANFQNMRSLSMMQRLKPIIDEYHNTIFKIENFKAKWVPYVINIDLQAMENVALGTSGDKISEREVLELVFQNFVALGRRMDVSGNLQNYKMVDVEMTGMHHEYTVLAGDLARLLSEMRDVTGLNDLTDGSTPGERTLNYVASLGAEATNNALYNITWADKCTAESLAKGVILRLVQLVQKKDIEGITRTLGDETVRFIRVTKDIAKRVWDIKLEDKPTDAQREALMAQLNIKDNQGLIGPDDVIMVTETHNLKQARVLLSHRIKMRRKEIEDAKKQDSIMNGQIQQQSSIVAEEQKRRTLSHEYRLKTKFEIAKMEKEKELLEMKLKQQYHNTDVTNATKLIQSESKKEEISDTE